jgi:hypothetical protein
MTSQTRRMTSMAWLLTPRAYAEARAREARVLAAVAVLQRDGTWRATETSPAVFSESEREADTWQPALWRAS